MNRAILSARKTARTATAAPLGQLAATAALLLAAVGGIAANQGVTPFVDSAASDLSVSQAATADDPWV
ncbi:hypothetical protein OG429_40540 (plasmid) [Streptomyces sp. NBC_00190]|uniref:hypothetical protein n=1 Tax=unclassified Streptomyces TaxID=2593676 RepID=UPI002E2ACCA1|nr:hypothetical protein [Streptomyces sp. NBC_00190]WSZ45747.1 hypothetical protein OG239_44085 [Streptomyces sp. NBC_00868]